MFWLCMMAFAEEAPTLAGQQDVEEIIVWAKPFARFDDTRWVVRSEVVTPSQIQVGTPTHRIRTRAWQLEAVVHCRVDDRGRLREADCAVEDAAIRAHSTHPRTKDTLALQAMAESLKGASVSMQVNAKGRVPNLGVDGMETDNFEERQVADGARVMLGQLAAAFHMEMPNENPVGAEWQVEREPLLGIAAPLAGMASVSAVHRIDALDGHWVQQTIGRATSTTRAANPTAGSPCQKDDGNVRCPKVPPVRVLGRGVNAPPPNMVEIPDGMGVPLYPEEPDTLDLELRYTLDLNAVSVIDPDQGYPIERVWSVVGSPSASSTSSNYWAAGTLRQLGPREAVTLGSSGIVAAPGEGSDEVPAWVNITQ